MGEQIGASAGREHLNRRQALGLGGAAAATVAAASLVASGPASAAEAEAEAELDAGGHRGTTVLRSVSLAQANRIVAAAVRYVRAQNLPPMYVVVVDVAGNDKASRRMDGNGIASLALVPGKARTALAFRAPTLAFGAGVTDPGRIASFTTAGFSLLGGGRPITEADGTVIGAVAVGGGSPEQDDQVAEAALLAL